MTKSEGDKTSMDIAGFGGRLILQIIGDTSGFKTDKKPVVHSRYMKSGLSA